MLFSDLESPYVLFLSSLLSVVASQINSALSFTYILYFFGCQTSEIFLCLEKSTDLRILQKGKGMAETEMFIPCVPCLSQSHLGTLSLKSAAGNPQKVGYRQYHSSKAGSSDGQVASMCFQK